ncbi:MAG: DUF6715 family protein [Wujia sp.]
MKRKGFSIKGIIIAIALVGLVLFYFNYLSNRSSEQRTERAKTELEQLEGYNMTDEYPKTPRDVVKLHNRYMKVFYGQSLSDDELLALNEKACKLYCSELMAANTETTILNNLKKNIEDVKAEGYTYKSYALPEASQVQKFTRDGKEMATLEVTVTIETNDGMAYRYVQYILIMEDDQWKIYGWGDAQNETDQQSGYEN